MSLVIGPGSMGFFSMLGVLQVLEDNGRLSNVHEISGCSAGSMIGLLMSIKNPLSAKEIFERSLSIDVPAYTKPNLQTFLNNFGFVPHEPIRQLLIELCRGTNPTFKQLKKKLIVSACCINTQKTEYFSVDTHPDMYAIDAVCMSISIPVVFSPYTWNNKLYIDGGTIEKVPLGPFLHKDPSEVIIVCMNSVRNYKNEIKGVQDFIMACYDTYVNSMNFPCEFLKYEKYGIDSDAYDFHNFGLSYDDKMKLFILGQDIALQRSGVAK
jgi:predicted acylesterase/phospholipase RssA